MGSIPSIKSPNIYVNSETDIHLDNMNNQLDHENLIRRDSSQSEGPISAVNVHSVNTFSERVASSKAPTHVPSQLPASGFISTSRGGTNMHSQMLKADAKSEATILEGNCEDNSEDEQDGRASPTSSALSDRAKAAEGPQNNEGGNHDSYDNSPHHEEDYDTLGMDMRIESLIDSKLSVTSQNRQDLADVKRRISKLMGEAHSISTTRSQRVDDTRTTQLSQRQPK